MSKTQIFIEKARAKHGDRYDYSKVIYTRAKDKVIITCKVHGDFEQMAKRHVAGQGCAKCAVVARGRKKVMRAAAKFKRAARVKHGDRYDYDKVVYVRSAIKVMITCKEHGDFEQSPSDHLKGGGCAKCSGRHRYTTPEWVSEAKKAHGDRYDYSKTVYVLAKDKVTITCRKHGDFYQNAGDHLKGANCPKCSLKYGYTTPEWIAKARNSHGDRYDYSKTVYVHSSNKVIITCREHGDFYQEASSHIIGKGCPRCPRCFDQPTAVYLMQMGSQVKIGISIDPDARLAQLNRQNPKPARIIATWTLEDFPAAHAMEQRIHRKLKAYHAGLSGFNGATEWFNTSPERAKNAILKALSGAVVLSYSNAKSSQLSLI